MCCCCHTCHCDSVAADTDPFEAVVLSGTKVVATEQELREALTDPAVFVALPDHA